MLEEDRREGKVAHVLLEDAEAVQDVAVLGRDLVSLAVEAVVLDVELYTMSSRVQTPWVVRRSSGCKKPKNVLREAVNVVGGGECAPVSKLCLTTSAALVPCGSAGRSSRRRATSGRHHLPLMNST